MAKNNPAADFVKTIQAGLELSPDKKFYFNGFTVSVAPPDVIIVLMNNNQPIAFLNTSHIVAKTFVNNLQTVLSDFEKITGFEIPLLSEITTKIEDKNDAVAK